jgi:DNA-binding LytR/AlgR family response regulator
MIPKNMTCIIIDDEMMARAILEQYITSLTKIKVVEVFPNAITAIKYLNDHEVDVIFLDIHMPDFNGFDFIKTIKNPPKIVLVTSDKDYAFTAFEFDAIVDYLVKPITEERFKKAVSKLTNRTRVKEVPQIIKKEVITTDKNSDFYVNIGNRLIKIDFSQIILIKAQGDYVEIKTESNSYTVHSTLKKIESKLPKKIFMKIHRSYIINTRKIIDIENNSVLIGREIIPVSRTYKVELLNHLNVL